MIGPFWCLMISCSTVAANDVFYRSYRSINEYIDIPSGDTTQLYNTLDPLLPTVMFVHGWTEGCNNDTALTMISALLSNSRYNILCLDWSSKARADYILAASSTSDVASVVSQDIAVLCGNGFQSTDWHIIGYSLGAHVAGAVGNNLKRTVCKSLGKITALETAEPLFNPLACPRCRALQPNDADMTYACHSDGGVYGIYTPTAVFDFYLNSGSRIQPGCPWAPTSLDLTNILPEYRCSHERCVRLYSEAVQNSNAQVARKCNSYLEFSSNACSGNPTVRIGLEMATDISGTAFYKTNAEYPYSRGVQGASP